MKAKIVIAITALVIGGITPANADRYIKVNESGNVIGGVIECDAETCGDGSLYSVLTLAAGERYVKEGYQPTTLPVESNTYVPPTNVITGTITPRVDVTPIVVETTTAITDTTTATVETATATITNVTIDSLYTQIMALFNQLLALIAKLNR